MFPLHPDLLWFLKVFVVVSCIAFWVDVFYAARRRKARIEREHRHRRRYTPDDEHEEA